jgi:DNA-binding transcriptional MerR regulator
VSSRTYLSIGDVLTLLREEFPDVTISKIRFLESQGLVNPERSPSGYRKFFDHDVERLRWVLRQQREHFLPLKVIRDRLADGELDDAAAGPPNGKESTGTRAVQPVHAAAGATGVAGGVGSAAPSHDALRGDEPTKADEEVMARILADASRRAAQLPEDAQARRTLEVLGQEAPAAVAQVPAARGEAPAEKEVHAQARRSGKGATTPSGSTPAPAVVTTQTEAPGRAPASAGRGAVGADGEGNGSSQARSTAAQGGGRKDAAARATGDAGAGPRVPDGPADAGGPGAAEPGAGSAPGGGAPGAGAARPGVPAPGGAGAGAPGRGGPAAVVTGASLTAEELAGASGLSPEEVAALVSFGLIEPAVVAGIETFDEDALTVANLAASFRVYGIEARHLRMYRNAVDREIGLIEQVVIPLLRQRNPESRQRAVEAADELGALGQSMRATLLRQGLRRHLGG